MNKLLLSSAIAMALGISSSYAGDIVNINPDAGGADATQAVGSLGWNNGNAISTNVIDPASGALSPVGSTFQTYAHASLSNFNDANGNVIGGLHLNTGGGYEWTYVTGFQEVVSSLTGTPPNANENFKTVAGGTNFFQIYYDTARNADNLTGKGFNDGTLILSGTVLPFDAISGLGASTFNATGLGGQLDQFNTDNYPNVASIAGAGSSHLLVQVNSFDPAFFTGGISLLDISFDTFQNVPYGQQNPSSCFWDGSAYINGAGPITGGTASQTAAECAASSVGTINGVSGPNFMFETRATSALTSVPEPASLALLGVGLTGLGLARRRNKSGLQA